MRLITALLLFLSPLAPLAVPQDGRHSGDPNWSAVCENTTTQPLSAPKLTGPLPPDELAKCDERALYYGFGGRPDYAAALQCGWYERAHPQETNGNMFYGPGVLTMLYANGSGVQRDYNLAIRFACEDRWAADAENALRIGDLEFLRDHDVKTNFFDLCDDITSGLNQGACASISTRAADAKRAGKLQDVQRLLPADAQTLFPSLQKAESAFEESREETEIDLSGTARAAFQFADQTKLRDQFLINLQRFAKGEIPHATTAELARLDGEMNNVYRQIQNAPAKSWEFGTVKPEGIRQTERAWLALSAEWEKFGRAAYPNLSPESIRAQLIRLRLHQLRALLSAGS